MNDSPYSLDIYIKGHDPIHFTQIIVYFIARCLIINALPHAVQHVEYIVIALKVQSKNIWSVKIKIAVVRLLKSLVIFIVPSCHL
jgi:hypothetical protein